MSASRSTDASQETGSPETTRVPSPSTLKRYAHMLKHMSDEGKKKVAHYDRRRQNLNLQDANGRTFLHSLINMEANCNVGTFKALVDCKVDLTITNNCGQNPLLFAVTKDNSNLARILLLAGADPNAVNPITEETTTMVASSKEMLDLLIEHNANMNLKDSRGNNALHIQCSRVTATLDDVDLMVSNGADYTAVNANGRLPLYYAQNASIIKYLTQMAKTDFPEILKVNSNEATNEANEAILEVLIDATTDAKEEAGKDVPVEASAEDPIQAAEIPPETEMVDAQPIPVQQPKTKRRTRSQVTPEPESSDSRKRKGKAQDKNKNKKNRTLMPTLQKERVQEEIVSDSEGEPTVVVCPPDATATATATAATTTTAAAAADDDDDDDDDVIFVSMGN